MPKNTETSTKKVELATSTNDVSHGKMGDPIGFVYLLAISVKFIGTYLEIFESVYLAWRVEHLS